MKKLLNADDFDKKLESKLKECLEDEMSDKVIIDIKAIRKAIFAAEHDEKFTDIRVYRVPWADKYRDLDDIPAEVYLENGWDITCAKCGGRVSADTAVFTTTDVICRKCAGKDGK